MTVSLGPNPRYLEELRIGGGHNAAPDGGADFDKAGNIAANGTLDLGGAASFASDVSVAGDFAVTGVDTTWSVYLPANLGMPDPALPCGPVAIANWRDFQVATASLAFDPDSPQAAYFQFRLPESYDGRALKFTLDWSATTGTSGDVRWGINAMGFGDGDTLEQIGALAYTVDAFQNAENFHVAFIEQIPTNFNVGGFMTLRVLRDAAQVSDTFDGDTLLIGVRVSY